MRWTPLSGDTCVKLQRRDNGRGQLQTSGMLRAPGGEADAEGRSLVSLVYSAAFGHLSHLLGVGLQKGDTAGDSSRHRTHYRLPGEELSAEGWSLVVSAGSPSHF